MISGAHVSHLESTPEEELNRLLGIVVDVENLFMCVHKEEDADTKQVYFYLFKVFIGLQFISNISHLALIAYPLFFFEDVASSIITFKKQLLVESKNLFSPLFFRF